MEKYKCPICGEKHDVYRGLEISLPNALIGMSDEERSERVQEFAKGFFIVDKKDFYVNGYIYLELENEEFPFFYWKVCASIAHEKFVKNLARLKIGEAIEFEGKLENQLPLYEDALGLDCKVLIQLTSEDIIIEIKVEGESQLKKDQSKPINKERVIELMGIIYHNKANQEKKSDKPFSDRFKNEILDVEKDYIEKSKEFSINICAQSKVLFQVVSSNMLELGSENKKGFGLHLSFDQSFEECIKEIEKFRKTKYVKDFDYHELDKIPTYQIDLGKDKKRLEELINSLVREVYEEELELIDLDNFEI